MEPIQPAPTSFDSSRDVTPEDLSPNAYLLQQAQCPLPFSQPKPLHHSSLTEVPCSSAPSFKTLHQHLGCSQQFLTLLIILTFSSLRLLSKLAPPKPAPPVSNLLLLHLTFPHATNLPSAQFSNLLPNQPNPPKLPASTSFSKPQKFTQSLNFRSCFVSQPMPSPQPFSLLPQSSNPSVSSFPTNLPQLPPSSLRHLPISAPPLSMHPALLAKFTCLELKPPPSLFVAHSPSLPRPNLNALTTSHPDQITQTPPLQHACFTNQQPNLSLPNFSSLCATSS